MSQISLSHREDYERLYRAGVACATPGNPEITVSALLLHVAPVHLNTPLHMHCTLKCVFMCVAYTIAKYGMSLCVLGMSEELRPDGIAVNALWPKTGIVSYHVQFTAISALVLYTVKVIIPQI